MAEHRKNRAGTNREQGPDRDEASRRADDEGRAREAEEIGHEANVNQAREEPMPASHHDDQGQQAVVRNEQHAHGSEERRRAEERG